MGCGESGGKNGKRRGAVREREREKATTGDCRSASLVNNSKKERRRHYCDCASPAILAYAGRCCRHRTPSVSRQRCCLPLSAKGRRKGVGGGVRLHGRACSQAVRSDVSGGRWEAIWQMRKGRARQESGHRFAKAVRVHQYEYENEYVCMHKDGQEPQCAGHGCHWHQGSHISCLAEGGRTTGPSLSLSSLSVSLSLCREAYGVCFRLPVSLGAARLWLASCSSVPG